jgi:hypothetical protein
MKRVIVLDRGRDESISIASLLILQSRIHVRSNSNSLGWKVAYRLALCMYASYQTTYGVYMRLQFYEFPARN